MPDFAPSATPRWKVVYRSAGFEHTMEFRAARGVSNSANISNGRAAAAGLVSTLEALLPEDFQFIAEFYCPEDEDIFLPTGALPANPTGEITLAEYSPHARAVATTFSGKGGVAKARVTVFGVMWDLGAPAGVAGNGMVTSLESVQIDAAIDFLNSAAGLRSVANEPVIWYPRATVKVNDHWLKEARKLYP